MKIYIRASQSDTIANGNAKLLPNYTGELYFISDKDLGTTTLYPRIPNNYFTSNNYEDNTTPRVCFAPTIKQCLAGLSQNVEGKTYYVYSPVSLNGLHIYQPNHKAVPDVDITGELWVTDPVEVEQVDKITVTGNEGKEGRSFSYGDQTAELYDDWTYVNSTTKTNGAKDYNFDEWGQSPDTNILYILGHSGSGKSTKAKELALEYNADVIHLDLYFEGYDNDPNRSASFDAYLKSNFPDYVKIPCSDSERASNEWGELVDQFAEALLDYGKYMYGKGTRVIAEGVQLMDDTIFPNKSFFKTVPTLVMTTNQFVSNMRSAVRDKVSLKNYLSNRKNDKFSRQALKEVKKALRY